MPRAPFFWPWIVLWATLSAAVVVWGLSGLAPQPAAEERDPEELFKLAETLSRWEIDRFGHSLAAPLYEKAARLNHPGALTNLGLRLLSGRGVPRDLAKAFASFEKAATLAHPDGIYNLALAYAYGLGTEIDPEKAHALFHRASASGHALSLYNLGVGYLLGFGVARDEARAIFYLEMASHKGHVDSLVTLGLIYRDGLQSVNADCPKAAGYLAAAARARDPDALYALAALYHNGDCLKPNQALAMALLRQAAEGGNFAARAILADETPDRSFPARERPAETF
ncbi:MAG: sel1 repeat family protein [Deltaproteobacteria bacterium]|jgi:TPR repeat protein|nr:sel1 repeat family protein [Deltaproteobacteria bacterium]